MSGFFLEDIEIPLGRWVQDGVRWIQRNDTAQQILGGVEVGVRALVEFFEGLLTLLPLELMALVIVVLSFWRVGWRFGVFSVLGLFFIIAIGLWNAMISTLALVLSASTIALVIGMPIGIAMARRSAVEQAVKPVLDFMQTMPPFVYLIPAVIFFGLGKVPGAIATVVFAMPPAVRLTALGIKQVSVEKVEAGQAFGCTSTQLLLKVQLPLALPSIMAGINQTIMLSLSMVVIASMIGAGGLGDPVLAGIQRLQVGTGFEGGLGVVILAILLDRITQSFAPSRERRRGGAFAFLRRWAGSGERSA